MTPDGFARLRRFSRLSPRVVTVDPVDTPDAGLTLIEMIVALAVGALVVAFLAQGTGLLRAFARVEGTISAQDETLAIRDHLRHLIAGAMTGGSGGQRNVLAGVGDTMVFTIPGDRLLEAGGLVRITLAAISEGRTISLAETREPMGGASEGGNRTRRLVDGAARIGFSFYGALSGDAGPSWTPEWTDPEISPQLVRIDVTFPKGDARRWPPFVVLVASGGASPAGSAQAASPPAPTQATSPGKS